MEQKSPCSCPSSVAARMVVIILTPAPCHWNSPLCLGHTQPFMPGRNACIAQKGSPFCSYISSELHCQLPCHLETRKHSPSSLHLPNRLGKWSSNGNQLKQYFIFNRKQTTRQCIDSTTEAFFTSLFPNITLFHKDTEHRRPVLPPPSYHLQENSSLVFCQGIKDEG